MRTEASRSLNVPILVIVCSGKVVLPRLYRDKGRVKKKESSSTTNGPEKQMFANVIRSSWIMWKNKKMHSQSVLFPQRKLLVPGFTNSLLK